MNLGRGAPSDGKSGVEGAKVRTQLGSVLVLDSVQAEGTGGLDEFEDIVNENGLTGRSVYGFEGGLENHRRRLTGANRAGVDARGSREELKKRECRLEMRYVDGIGVGKQGELVLFRESLEEIVGLQGNWIK
jgi:hypothetical protein